jgi:hypothetical protein
VKYISRLRRDKDHRSRLVTGYFEPFRIIEERGLAVSTLALSFPSLHLSMELVAGCTCIVRSLEALSKYVCAVDFWLWALHSRCLPPRSSNS